MTGEIMAWLGHMLIALSLIWIAAVPLIHWEKRIFSAISWWLKHWRWTWIVTAICGCALTWIGLRV